MNEHNKVVNIRNTVSDSLHLLCHTSLCIMYCLINLWWHCLMWLSVAVTKCCPQCPVCVPDKQALCSWCIWLKMEVTRWSIMYYRASDLLSQGSFIVVCRAIRSSCPVVCREQASDLSQFNAKKRSCENWMSHKLQLQVSIVFWQMRYGSSNGG